MAGLLAEDRQSSPANTPISSTASSASRPARGARRRRTPSRGSSYSKARPIRRPAPRVRERRSSRGASSATKRRGPRCDIGRDLSLIGRTERKWIVESDPPAEKQVVAPPLPGVLGRRNGRAARPRTASWVGTHLDKSAGLHRREGHPVRGAGDRRGRGPRREAIDHARWVARQPHGPGDQGLGMHSASRAGDISCVGSHQRRRSMLAHISLSIAGLVRAARSAWRL